MYNLKKTSWFMPSNPLESHILNFIGLIYSRALLNDVSLGIKSGMTREGGVNVKLSRLSSILSDALAGGHGTGCLICSTFIIYLLRISNQLKWGDGPFFAIPRVIKVRWYQHSVSMSPDGWVTRMRAFAERELCSFTYSKEICGKICILPIIVRKIRASQIILGWK